MRPLFLYAKKSLHAGVRTGCHYLISLSVCVCVTFVVFTGCESCTRLISTSPGSMETGEYGLTRGTFCRAPSRGGRGRRVAVDFVVCFGCGGVYFVFSMIDLHFPIRVHDLWLRETQSSQRRLVEAATTASHSAHRKLAPTDAHQVYHLLCSHLRVIASVDQ